MVLIPPGKFGRCRNKKVENINYFHKIFSFISFILIEKLILKEFLSRIERSGGSQRH